MPIGFLTAAERDRLNHFPTQIPDEGLRAFFLLTEDDQRVINHSARPRPGWALRYSSVPCATWGFAPDDLHTTPKEVVTYVARQLEVSPRRSAYGRRRKTRTTHLVQIQRYLGFRLATPLDLYALQTWLEERALEHDKPMLLLQLACDQLHHDRIVRPGLTRLERLIATARQQAHLETFRRLTPLLTEAQRAMLDQTASKFSLRIWLDKPTVSGHRNSVKLQTLTVSLGSAYPAAMRPWRRRADGGTYDRVNYPPA